jgi:hypothetical protein
MEMSSASLNSAADLCFQLLAKAGSFFSVAGMVGTKAWAEGAWL